MNGYLRVDERFIKVFREGFLKGRRVFSRVGSYARLIRLDKPVGILLLLWPTLWGLWLAGVGHPSSQIVFIFVLGTILMRSAGCAVNDWADRHIDPHVQRTRLRPLAIQEIYPWEALCLAVLLTMLALGLAWQLNCLALMLAIPAALIAASYPFFKRFFPLPQLYLGLAFSFGIPMAYAALQNGVPLIAWILCGLNVLWVFAYDTIYALVDRTDDAKIGIRTSVLTLASWTRCFIGLAYAVFLLGMFGVGMYLELAWPYYLSLAAAMLLVFGYMRLIWRLDPADCFYAFRMNHWLGCVVFLGVVAQFYI